MLKKITVHLTPSAGFNQVTQITPTAFKVHTTALPENNKANQAMIKMLSKFLGIPQSAISIKVGATMRKKILLVQSKPDSCRNDNGKTSN